MCVLLCECVCVYVCIAVCVCVVCVCVYVCTCVCMTYRYIRREKQISDTKMELAQSQKIRLQESCDHLQRKLTETEKFLTEERERNTMSMKSAEEHAAILAKVSTGGII